MGDIIDFISIEPMLVYHFHNKLQYRFTFILPPISNYIFTHTLHGDV